MSAVLVYARLRLRSAATTANRYLLPAGPTAANPLQQHAAVTRWDRQTDGWTLYCYIDPAMHAVSLSCVYLIWTEPSKFHSLLDAWFPENGNPPSAFLIDTSEEALLLPDWLKLRMIRSSVMRLVDAGTCCILSLISMCICNFFPLCRFSHYFSIYMFAFNGGVYSFGACLLSHISLLTLLVMWLMLKQIRVYIQSCHLQQK